VTFVMIMIALTFEWVGCTSIYLLFCVHNFSHMRNTEFHMCMYMV